MKLLFDNFDILAESPGGVQKLRKMILQLAVQGKLVPQNSEEEPANNLLEDIAKERKILELSKKTKKLGPIEPVEKNLPVPNGWAVVRFGRIVYNRDGERIPLSKEVRASRGGKYNYYGASGIIDNINDFIFSKDLLLIGEDGANLINRSTPIAFIAHGKYWVNNHAHVLDGYSFDLLKYLSDNRGSFKIY